MNNQPFHAPVKDPKRILDIGCGTGAMTILLARMYPDAEVIGVDISPVPSRHEQPSNLTYVQGNIMELPESDDPRFAKGSFDYVFHRLLVLGMTNWPAYIATVRDLLIPGGWAEMHDMDVALWSRDGSTCVSDTWWHQERFHEDCVAIGLDINIGRKLAGYVKDAGLVNVSGTVYKLPYIPEPDLPGAELIAEANQKIMGPANRALIKKVSGPRRDAEVVEKMADSVVERFGQAKVGDYAPIYVVVSQKGE